MTVANQRTNPYRVLAEAYDKYGEEFRQILAIFQDENPLCVPAPSATTNAYVENVVTFLGRVAREREVCHIISGEMDRDLILELLRRSFAPLAISSGHITHEKFQSMLTKIVSVLEGIGYV